MKFSRRCSLILFLLLPDLADAAGPTERVERTIVMSTLAPMSMGKPLSLNAQIYSEAFHRLGYRLVVMPLPPLRATMLIELGLIDGELERSTEYGIAHPSLLRIDEVSQFRTLAAYVRDGSIKTFGWSSFNSSGHRFEYRMGIHVAEAGMANLVPNGQVSTINNTTQGLRKLALGRTDVYIDFDERVSLEMKTNPLLQDQRIYRSGTVQRVRLHAYLNQKNAALAPRLVEVLSAMKREGVVANYERAVKSETNSYLASR
ncbi:hypothetical protein GJ698_26000 [Pseudoduganella sp. FT26W]|uniref:Transporter substrate-binding domain-containing protein n=1 Tax=Duganella aquatilis TaxID=2666082 RepID=A0A844DGQ4_9BURK|nr:hypothetical protein [Duganella aquatilis]MRW87529.1 hypothetical protein [Duganella aquatilis]